MLRMKVKGLTCLLVVLRLRWPGGCGNVDTYRKAQHDVGRNGQGGSDIDRYRPCRWVPARHVGSAGVPNCPDWLAHREGHGVGRDRDTDGNDHNDGHGNEPGARVVADADEHPGDAHLGERLGPGIWRLADKEELLGEDLLVGRYVIVMAADAVVDGDEERDPVAQVTQLVDRAVSESSGQRNFMSDLPSRL